MWGRGTVTRRIFAQLKDVLTTGDAVRSPSWGGLPKDDVADEVLATAPPRRSRTASPRISHNKRAMTTLASLPPNATPSVAMGFGKSPGPMKENSEIIRPGAKAAANTS